MHTLLRHLRQAVLLHGAPGLSDAQLLDQFLTHREEAAFEALLRRHGPMVLGVCRRVLRNPHDAEDAFQAVFLVFFRKAGSIRPRELVGNWLYGVAVRTALRARTLNARRRAREEKARSRRPWTVPPEPCGDELFLLLDQELARLPEKYRAPVILCDLEGQSRTEAARKLGWPVGTLSWRLAAGRKHLARTLARRGLALSAGALAPLLLEGGASAHVPGPLLASTTKAALLMAAGCAAAASAVPVKVAALTEGVMQTMFLAKLKTAPVVMCAVAALGLTTGGWLYQSRADGDPNARPAAARASDGRVVQNQQSADDRERTLRQELEEARREAKLARDEAQRERERAEAALQDARLQLDKARQAEQTARQQAARIQYSQAVQQAARDWKGGRPKSPDGPAADVTDKPKQADNYERAKQELNANFEARRQQILSQLQELEAQQKKMLDAMDQKRSDALADKADRKATPQRHTGGDEALNQILQRLEKMERRLEKLEKANPQDRDRPADPDRPPAK